MLKISKKCKYFSIILCLYFWVLIRQFYQITYKYCTYSNMFYCFSNCIIKEIWLDRLFTILIRFPKKKIYSCADVTVMISILLMFATVILRFNSSRCHDWEAEKREPEAAVSFKRQKCHKSDSSDYTKCIICQQSSQSTLHNVQLFYCIVLQNACTLRQDDIAKRLLQNFADKS